MKSKQKKLLTDIMKGDEDAGLYENRLFTACQVLDILESCESLDDAKMLFVRSEIE